VKDAPTDTGRLTGMAIDDASFKKLSRMVYDDSGIVLAERKRNLIVSRLSRRLRALNLSDFAAYCQHLNGNGGAEERRQLLSHVTTNVTRFFREDHHFDVLKDEVLPVLLDRARTGGRVRIWSAGCSTGEEPYSIAMTLMETCRDAAKMDIRILATDIDPVVVARAQQGIYQSIEEDHLPRDLRDRYFDPVAAQQGAFQAKDNLRKLVTFAELNLLSDWPMQGPFDAIFCRNVLIYFDAETQTQILDRFAGILASDGRLFLGHSERAPTGPSCRLMPAGVTQYRLA